MVASQSVPMSSESLHIFEKAANSSSLSVASSTKDTLLFNSQSRSPSASRPCAHAATLHFSHSCTNKNNMHSQHQYCHDDSQTNGCHPSDFGINESGGQCADAKHGSGSTMSRSSSLSSSASLSTTATATSTSTSMSISAAMDAKKLHKHHKHQQQQQNDEGSEVAGPSRRRYRHAALHHPQQQRSHSSPAGTVEVTSTRTVAGSESGGDSRGRGRGRERRGGRDPFEEQRERGLFEKKPTKMMEIKRNSSTSHHRRRRHCQQDESGSTIDASCVSTVAPMCLATMTLNPRGQDLAVDVQDEQPKQNQSQGQHTREGSAFPQIPFPSSPLSTSSSPFSSPSSPILAPPSSTASPSMSFSLSTPSSPLSPSFHLPPSSSASTTSSSSSSNFSSSNNQSSSLLQRRSTSSSSKMPRPWSHHAGQEADDLGQLHPLSLPSPSVDSTNNSARHGKRLSLSFNKPSRAKSLLSFGRSSSNSSHLSHQSACPPSPSTAVTPLSQPVGTLAEPYSHEKPTGSSTTRTTTPLSLQGSLIAPQGDQQEQTHPQQLPSAQDLTDSLAPQQQPLLQGRKNSRQQHRHQHSHLPMHLHHNNGQYAQSSPWLAEEMRIYHPRSASMSSSPYAFAALTSSSASDATTIGHGAGPGARHSIVFPLDERASPSPSRPHQHHQRPMMMDFDQLQQQRLQQAAAAIIASTHAATSGSHHLSSSPNGTSPSSSASSIAAASVDPWRDQWLRPSGAMQSLFRDRPSKFNCPHCGATKVRSNIEFVPGMMSFLVSFGLLFLTVGTLSFLPFRKDHKATKDCVHWCPRCETKVARFVRASGTWEWL